MHGKFREKVRAYIFDPDDRLLVAHFPGHVGPAWEIPGGGIEAGESKMTALKRELREELGQNDFILIHQLFGHSYEIFSYQTITTFALPYIGQQITDFILRAKEAEQIDLKMPLGEIRTWDWVSHQDMIFYLSYPGQYADYLKVFNQYKSLS